jgi:hypothetical protein
MALLRRCDHHLGAGRTGSHPDCHEGAWVSFKEALNSAVRVGLTQGRPKRLYFVQRSNSLGGDQNFRWDKVLAAENWALSKAADRGCSVRPGRSSTFPLSTRRAVSLQVRQCQRLFRQLGFRLRKPRPVLARAHPARQGRTKKFEKS